jgi:hypothetical protein
LLKLNRRYYLAEDRAPRKNQFGSMMPLGMHSPGETSRIGRFMLRWELTVKRATARFGGKPNPDRW